MYFATSCTLYACKINEDNTLEEFIMLYKHHVLCLDILVEGGLRLKGSLAKRLGGFVDSTENKIDMLPQKVKSKCPCSTHDAYHLYI